MARQEEIARRAAQALGPGSHSMFYVYEHLTANGVPEDYAQRAVVEGELVPGPGRNRAKKLLAELPAVSKSGKLEIPNKK